MMNKWYWTVIHASYVLLTEGDCSSPSEKIRIMPAALRMNIHQNPGISHSLFVFPALVQRPSQVHPKFSTALWRAPKHITIIPIFLLYQSSEIPVTLKACRNTLLGSNTLLILTLLSLHSTSSQTLLEYSRDYNTYCWCIGWDGDIGCSSQWAQEDE
jgi:hypothetical protein